MKKKSKSECHATPRGWNANLAAQLHRWDSCQVLVKSVFSCCWTDLTPDLSLKAAATATKLQLLDKMNKGEAIVSLAAPKKVIIRIGFFCIQSESFHSGNVFSFDSLTGFGYSFVDY